jgi:hypothetical protein
MAVLNATQMAKLTSFPIDYPEVADVGGRLRIFNEKITLAGQTTADTIQVAKLPRGARVLFGVLVSTVSLGSSTIAIGVSGTAGKYRAASVFASADAPTFFGVAANVGEPLTAEETVIITIGAASLPGAGTLRVMMVYTVD